MRSYVITIIDNVDSCSAADRCIESGKRFGVHIDRIAAYVPADNPSLLMKHNGINDTQFDEVYSDTNKCKAAFMSHYACWKLSVSQEENILILEHDAIFVNNLPKGLDTYNGLCSFGKPSYGRFNIPQKLGYNKLVSKQYLPGAHAYLISPAAAKEVIKTTILSAEPTDVFLNNVNFPFIQEYYPYPIEAHDTFTTIQNKHGCQAKHNFNKEYKIL